MTDSELTGILNPRWLAVRERVAAACRRANRDANEVTIIAVTKTVSVRVAQLAFEFGLTNLAESKPQELWRKQRVLPQATWHLIGHLQRNKLEKTVPLAAMIHSVDSLRLLEALDAFDRSGAMLTALREHDGESKPKTCLPKAVSMAPEKPISILLEVNCSREANKGGFTPADVLALCDRLPAFTGVRIEGLMTMAALEGDPELCRPTFAELRTLRDDLARRTGLPLPQLSMGMSNDFEIAIEEGATMVRLGTVLFEGMS